MSARHEAAHYAELARRDYTPPGPPSDPWGPFIVEAANKYDVPELWIRQVIRQESGGRLYENGQLITSSAGAMGLMQVMPETFDELRQRYGLGEDPYDPHDNIMAGTAYVRELYDIYGSPGFLAAYNAGPGRLDDYLTRHRALPDETRNYVARIGPNIAGVYPQRLSPATQYAMNALPTNIPPGPRYPQRHGPAPVAIAAATPRNESSARGEIQVASLAPPPPPPVPQPRAVPAQVASASLLARQPTTSSLAPPPPPPPPARTPPAVGSLLAPHTPAVAPAVAPATPAVAPSAPLAVASLPPPPPPPSSPPPSLLAMDYAARTAPHGFSLIPHAMADTLPPHPPGPVVASAAGGNWAIQVGAFVSESQAQAAADAARSHTLELASARMLVGQVHQSKATLYRARLTGLSREAALLACEKLNHHGACIVVSPNAQS